MFVINEDFSIHLTRGDIAFFQLSALKNEEETYKFQPGDLIRFKVFEKKACENVAFQKDFPIEEETDVVEILLEKTETKIGEVISKPTDYWYEIELNPFTNPQTILGYDDDGAKIFKLFPEGADIDDIPIDPEDIPIVDPEIDMTSERPVQNQAVARAIIKLRAELIEMMSLLEPDEEINLDHIATKEYVDNLVGENLAALASLVGGECVMSTFQTVYAQIQTLLDSANVTTGNANTTLTDGVNALIEGFGKGGAEELYEALKDSGIVTEDMTFEEMCEALKNHFPGLYELYMTSANEGGFAACPDNHYAYYDYTCFAPSVTFGDVMTVAGSQKYQGAYGTGGVISKLVDLNNYDKIVFDYECAIPAAANDNFIGVFITPTQQAILKDVAVYTEDLLQGGNSATSKGAKAIDVSALSGQFYIGFSMQYTVSASIKISNMYMTGAGSSSGGEIIFSDDGNGNVTISNVMLADDGNGNVTMGV